MFIDILPVCMLMWGCWILWNWSDRQLWAATKVLGIEQRLFGRTSSNRNHRTISPVPERLFYLYTITWSQMLGPQVGDSKTCAWHRIQFFQLQNCIVGMNIYFILELLQMRLSWGGERARTARGVTRTSARHPTACCFLLFASFSSNTFKHIKHLYLSDALFSAL